MQHMLGVKARRNALIKLRDASFYRASASIGGTTPVFSKLTASFPGSIEDATAWGIVGATSAIRSEFLHVLRGEYICHPTDGRSYPYLTPTEAEDKKSRYTSSRSAFQYVGFDNERGSVNLRGSYLSQRYESKREVDDYTVRDLLLGKTALNADHGMLRLPPENLLNRIVADLRLQKLLDMPVSHLSNGQTRRTRIAKALLTEPDLLMLDSPFMGLDVSTVEHLAKVLGQYAQDASPYILLSLREDEYVPAWLSDYIMLNDQRNVQFRGSANELKKYLTDVVGKTHRDRDMRHTLVAPIKAWGRGKQYQGQNVIAEDVRADWTAVNDPALAVDGQAAAEPNDIEGLADAGTSALSADDNQSGTSIAGEQHPRALNTLQQVSRHLLKSLCVNDRSHRKQMYAKNWRISRTRHFRPPVLRKSKDGFLTFDEHQVDSNGEPLIEMNGVQVKYGDKTVLGAWDASDETTTAGLSWTVRRGDRWGVFGPNGSGKTTLTALITSDHPQSYSLPIKFFGRARLPEPGVPGISYFELQRRIGFSSPEAHAFFPKHVSLRQALESAWAETPWSKAEISPDVEDRINATLLWFRAELAPDLGMTDLQKDEFFRPVTWNTRLFTDHKTKGFVKARYDSFVEERITANQSLAWADDRTFGSLPFTSQRLLLFLRAIIKQPDIVILDEAFSGLDALTILKCQCFLSHGDTKSVRLFTRPERGMSEAFSWRSDLDIYGLSRIPGLTDQQALIFISHRQEEVPGCVRHWLTLPEPGEGQPRTGVWDGPLSMEPDKWRALWNLPLVSPKTVPDVVPAYLLNTRKPGARFRRVERESLTLEEERTLRKRLRAERRWWEPNVLRNKVYYVNKTVRQLDQEFRVIQLRRKLPDASDTLEQRPATRLLIRAEYLFHDTIRSVQAVLYQMQHDRSLCYRRRMHRIRTIHKPRAKTYVGDQHMLKRGKIDLHGIPIST